MNNPLTTEMPMGIKRKGYKKLPAAEEFVAGSVIMLLKKNRQTQQDGTRLKLPLLSLS